MTPLAAYTAFPAKTRVDGAVRYEIRRSRPDNDGSVRWPGDQPTRAGYETTYNTQERAQNACDRINVAEGKCVIINLRKEVIAELRAAEEGAYEDAEAMKGTPHDPPRPLETHIFKVAERSNSRLIIRCREEAEDAYYAVCSGTFSLRSMACYKAAIRIAVALQPYAKVETVRQFPISHIERPE